MNEGRQWKTIARVGNIHFIEKRNSNESSAMPMHTHTTTKVYASVVKGQIRDVAIMNPRTREKVMEFHLAHKHGGLVPHLHRGNGLNRTDGTEITRPQLKFLESIKEKFNTIRK